FTTTIAAIIALLFYIIIQPIMTVISIDGSNVITSPSYIDEFLKMIPNNMLQPFLEGNVVSIMLLSLLLGVGITKLPAEQRMPIHQLLQSLFHMMIQLTRWIVSFMPIAIWGFMTLFVAELSNGLAFEQLGCYVLTILSANLVQGLIILPLFLWWHGLSPRLVFAKMLPAISFAFFS